LARTSSPNDDSTSALDTVQRHVMTRGRASDQMGPVGQRIVGNLGDQTPVFLPFGTGGQGGLRGMASRHIPPFPPLQREDREGVLRKGGTNIPQLLSRSLVAPLAFTTRGEARAAIAEQGPTPISVWRRRQPEESGRPVWSPAVAVGEDAWSGWQATLLSSTLTRAGAPPHALLSLLDRFPRRTDQSEQASSGVTRSAMHDMPLAPLLGTESRSSALLQPRSSGTIAQKKSTIADAYVSRCGAEQQGRGSGS
jgi:hypothetical protein